MTGGNARHGRRDNGLYAAEYAIVGDIDPRVGEHLLDVLGNRGIAAYLQPTADQHPVTRLTTLPSRPTDRLYVDRAELDAAREFLDILATGAQTGQVDLAGAPETVAPETVEQDVTLDRAVPDRAVPDRGLTERTAEHAAIEPPEDTPLAGAPATRTSSDFEDAWASIVAGFDRTADRPTVPWPAGEDIVAPSEQAPVRPGDADAPASGTAREWPRWSPADRVDPDTSLLDGLDDLGTGLPDEEDADYQPPPPPPLPRLAAITIIGILGILTGIAVIAYPNLLPVDPTTAAVLGCASLLAGAIVLIGRLRSGDEDEPEDPDHGAVV